jgi:S1-C subfamily serine protease
LALILTNNHVIQGRRDRVTLHDGRELDAELLGADQETDIALLQIDADGLTMHCPGRLRPACGSVISWWRSATPSVWVRP